jgi:16S rRNA (uracil1498-N3)-methyltransferase
MNNKKLSGIELYFSPPFSIKDRKITVQGGEARHILTVMRHITGDEIFITNGMGVIFKADIINNTKEIVEAQIIEEFNFTNYHDNMYFCIPRLKNPDRFETALEKCVELGITHFIIYDSERAIPKGNKKERWEKILLSAMKQSLRSFLPDLLFVKSLHDIKFLKGQKILFLQEAEQTFDKSLISKDSKYYFIFGPEGDLTDEEKNWFKADEYYNLGDNRLRSETAIIKCASLL